MAPLHGAAAQTAGSHPRPLYVGIDLVDRTVYEPGEVTSATCCSHTTIPVARSQSRTILPVLIMTLTFPGS
ncbi:hypothetical protein [Catellatospora sp. NPDC049609]|uniref:hypothetical protein n=1 Tax=Catellatospora sp. NPDC049609 TaxID=3155505 RepID=UPI00343B28F0